MSQADTLIELMSQNDTLNELMKYLYQHYFNLPLNKFIVGTFGL